MEDLAGDVVDLLSPAVELIGAIVIGVGVLVVFGSYVLSEPRSRPPRYEEIRLLPGRFLALGVEAMGCRGAASTTTRAASRTC